MFPKDVLILILRTCEYVTIHDKRGLSKCDKVKDLETGRLLDHPGGPSLIT